MENLNQLRAAEEKRILDAKSMLTKLKAVEELLNYFKQSEDFTPISAYDVYKCIDEFGYVSEDKAQIIQRMIFDKLDNEVYLSVKEGQPYNIKKVNKLVRLLRTFFFDVVLTIDAIEYNSIKYDFKKH